MNTAELVAVEIVIVLGAVILLGTLTLTWTMFGTPEQKKGNSRNRRSLKRKRSAAGNRPRREPLRHSSKRRPAPGPRRTKNRERKETLRLQGDFQSSAGVYDGEPFR